jgi:hypothetical protein
MPTQLQHQSAHPPPATPRADQGSALPTQGVDAQDPQFGPERQKDPSEEKMERSREKALNKQRQTQLEKDTERLLKLATELKQYVDKTDEHTLSLDVIKKAEEIEKLAKSIKEKMKGSY